MNLEKLSISELNQLKADIDAEFARRKDAERDNLIKEIAELAKTRGYALEDLLGKSSKKVASGARKPAGIKYRHPDNHELAWSGRGRQPAWFKECLANGQPIEKLSVK